ncbi:apolipoprotein L3-like [Petromyzon marinus]|uniref:apolipoprotein L3-like n=1 Tax=Petromyzon marinus TaxID=7757 RepID=UPI003F706865
MDGHEEQHDPEALYNHAKIQFIIFFNIWKKNRKISIKEMRRVADAMAKLEKDVNISQTVGTATSLIGGIVALAGIIAAPFTFGASALIAGVVGAGIGLTGGLVTAGSSLSKTFIKKYKLKTTDASIKLDTEMLEEFMNSLIKLNEACVALTDFDKQDHRVSSFRKAYRNLCRDMGVQLDSDGQFTESVAHVFIGVGIVPAKTADVVGSELVLARTANMGAKAALLSADLVNNAKMGASVVKTASMTVGRVALSGVLASLGVVFDVGFLAYLGRKLHKGSPSEVAKELQERANIFEQQLPKFDEFAKCFTGLPPSNLKQFFLQACRKWTS